MKNKYKILAYFFLIGSIYSETIIRGTVLDEQSNPIPYANVFIKDTFDGTSSDKKGQFLFFCLLNF